MLSYPAVFERDRDRNDGGYIVRFPDFEYGVTQGDNLADAVEMAEDLLVTMLADYIRQKKDFPTPSKPRGRNARMISLPCLPRLR